MQPPLKNLLCSASVQSLITLLVAGAAGFSVLAFVDALFAVALSVLMLWLAKSDLDRFELPDLANLAVGALGLIWLATQPDRAGGLLDAALRAAVAAACLVVVKWWYQRVRSFDGLGWGDVKLAAAGAIWLDWPQLPLALLIAAAGGLLVVAGRAALSSARITASTAIPFGAFLAPSIWLVWFAGLADLF
jgi:leader peptidase (prepilin peptidase)/N-methyltransferase